MDSFLLFHVVNGHEFLVCKSNSYSVHQNWILKSVFKTKTIPFKEDYKITYYCLLALQISGKSVKMCCKYRGGDFKWIFLIVVYGVLSRNTWPIYLWTYKSRGRKVIAPVIKSMKSNIFHSRLDRKTPLLWLSRLKESQFSAWHDCLRKDAKKSEKKPTIFCGMEMFYDLTLILVPMKRSMTLADGFYYMMYGLYTSFRYLHFSLTNLIRLCDIATLDSIQIYRRVRIITYVCKKRIIDRRPLMYNKIFLERIW